MFAHACMFNMKEALVRAFCFLFAQFLIIWLDFYCALIFSGRNSTIHLFFSSWYMCVYM